jgi:dTDP-4-amino-4,6-dideoxygalactose transaminase
LNLNKSILISERTFVADSTKPCRSSSINCLLEDIIAYQPVFSALLFAVSVYILLPATEVTEDLAWSGFSLPMFPELKDEQIVYIEEKMREFFKS